MFFINMKARVGARIREKRDTDGKFTYQFLSAYRGAFYIKGACGDGTPIATQRRFRG
jgi:hypothetical protein